MADEEIQLASLSLTHVHYNPADCVSYLCAWLALVPQGLCVVYVTLVWATREAEVALMFAGQLACEGLNWALKRWIKEERPKQMYGKGYGMPSSHAQFVAYFALSLALFLLVRHRPSPSPSAATGTTPTPLLHRAALALLVAAASVAVAASRVYLNYHTPKQVAVGAAAGLAFALLWFAATETARRTGWLAWALELELARRLRVRDLVVVEDLPEAGWARWEDERRRRKGEHRWVGGDKKAR